jgi:hypothetical protein
VSHKPALQAGVSAKADFNARLEGIVHSFEQNQIAFCVSFLVLFFGSIASKILVETIWSDVGAAIGAGGLLVQMGLWLIRGKRTEDQHERASLIVASADRVVHARDIDPREVVLAMRELVQDRKPLPSPDGTYSPPAGNEGERHHPYSAEEQRSFMERFAAEIKAHDERLLDGLQQMLKQLDSVRLQDGDAHRHVSVDERTVEGPK